MNLQEFGSALMVHNSATDTLASVSSTRFKKSFSSSTASLELNNISFEIPEFDTKSKFSVSAHKLLSKILVQFTAINHTGHRAKDITSRVIAIPLKDFAKSCGYDISNDCQLRNARNRIHKDLDALSALRLSFKYKNNDFCNVNMVEKYGIRRGCIYLHFTETFAKCLIQSPLTLYSDKLLTIDNRKNNAYRVGLKMIEHFNIKSNQAKGTCNTLKIKSLLKVTDLSDINACGVKANGWKKRIKEPLESAFKELIDKEVLCKYNYTKTFNSYEEWLETTINFYLNE